MQGFAPINFLLAGKILVILSFASFLLAGVGYFADWAVITQGALIAGLIIMAVGIYLIKITPHQT